MGGETAARTDERHLFAALPAGEAAPPALVGEALPTAGRQRHPAATSTAKALATALAAAARRDLAVEWDRGTGFLFLPVCMALGAIVYFTAPVEPGFAAIAVGVGALLASALLARDRPTAHRMLVAALMVTLGVLAAKAETWRADTLVNGSDVTTRVIGRVARIEHRADERVRLTLDLIDTVRPKLRYMPERVRLTARGAPTGLAPGAIVTGVARLMSPSGPVRPHSYDFAFESYFDGIGASGFFMIGPELLEYEYRSSLFQQAANWVERARLGLAARVEARIKGPEGEIAAALIAGVRAGIPEEINEALRRTGLAHVLSISGLHMALVAATVMGAMRALFALFPGFASRRPVKKYAAATALAACALYLAISGAEVAAQRSFIMLAVMLLALLFDRAALTMRNLAIAALIVLAISPHEVMGPSFQMSFAATAALIASYAAWTEYRQHRPPSGARSAAPARRMVGWVALFVGGLAMTSLVAGLATTVFGVYHFHRVSPYALAANLLAMPAVSILVMPMAVAAVALMPFGLEGWALDVMAAGIRIMNGVALWFSERTPIDAVGLIPVAALVTLTAALVLATLLTSRMRLLAVPVALVGFAIIAERRLPDVLVSEDGRLVALTTANGELAANRERPNGFTFENWMRAVAARDWIRPAETQAGLSEPGPDGGFVCRDKLCVARSEGGAMVVHAPDAAAAAPFCPEAALIVIDDATARNPCTTGEAAVLTKRDLARRGSASVYLEPQGAPLVIQALGEPFRPWHDHRRYSRAARGLPPWRKEDRE